MIIVMHIYLLKELFQSQQKQETTQIMLTKKVVSKNCAPFTASISEINTTQIDNPKHVEVIMPMYILIEYSDNCPKTSGSLW